MHINIITFHILTSVVYYHIKLRHKRKNGNKENAMNITKIVLHIICCTCYSYLSWYVIYVGHKLQEVNIFDNNIWIKMVTRKMAQK